MFTVVYFAVVFGAENIKKIVPLKLEGRDAVYLRLELSVDSGQKFYEVQSVIGVKVKSNFVLEVI